MPAAIAIGISPADFWDMTPQEFSACIAGRKQAIELDFKLFNQKAWLQGAYIQRAVGSVVGENARYPQKPIGLDPEREPTALELREKIKARIESIRVYEKGV